MFLVFAFFLFLAGFPINLSAKESIDKIMKKHVEDIERYKEEKNVKKLMYKLIVINRDIGIYYKKGFDYKAGNVINIIDKFVVEYNKKHPKMKLNKEYIHDYKHDIIVMLDKLPTDFFINRNVKSPKLPSDFFFNMDIKRAPINMASGFSGKNMTDEMDIGFTVGSIGGALMVVPNPVCEAIGAAMLLWGADELYHGYTEVKKEQKKKEKERAQQEQRRYEGRDCSQCSKKCRNCPYCRKRQGW